MISKNALGCGIYVIFLSALGSAQNCGPNPELNVTWSSNFKSASLHSACSASQGSAGLTYSDLAFQGNTNSSACSQDNLTDDQANQYVQAEIVNQKAAIVATCGYYACTMSNTNSSVPNIAALSEVCGQALAPSAAGYRGTVSGRDFKLVPAFMPLVIDQGSKTVRVYVQNLSNGSLKFDRPVFPNSNASVINPRSTTFAVAQHSGTWITLKLPKPTGLLPISVDLPIIVHGAADDQATVHFSLGQSPKDFLPPVGLGCGQMNPHMTATAYSDDPGRGPKPFTSNSFVGVPAGQANGFQGQYSEYLSNGGGQVRVTMDASCTQLDATRDHATTILQFTTTTTANSGHCCSGFGPGGEAQTSPEWMDEFVLSGGETVNWNVTAITDARLVGPSAACNIVMDGAQKPLTLNIQQTNVFPLKGGPHQLKIVCSEGQIGSRPGNWNDARTFTEPISITLDAHMN